MIEIDGSRGEGGGQVLRSSLALSIATGTPFRLTRIRAGRRKPGLGRQHLLCVRAAQAVSGAGVLGAELRSSLVEFQPGPLIPGTYELAVGTAGSACLVLQSILPALIRGSGPFEIRLGGGTHNPFAPPFDFLDRVYRRALAATGARVDLRLERHGFFPAGGGSIRARVEPAEALAPLDLVERGKITRRHATAIVSGLPASIAERELRVVEKRLGWGRAHQRVVEVRDPAGPGNAVLLEVTGEGVSEIVTAFGERRKRAEDVAREAVAGMRAYLDSTAPVGRHLADQLTVPMALGAGGRFRTGPLSRHAETNLETVERFVPGRLRTETHADGTVTVVVS